jgi:hypothetical protein
MADREPLDPELFPALESLGRQLGFSFITAVTHNAVTFYGGSELASRQEVEQRLLILITRFAMKAKFEWSVSNYERLTIFLVTPEESTQLEAKRTASEIVQGKIGATIGGKTRVYPNPDHEEVYVTLEVSDKYIECDARELPEGIKIYFGFPVMVDKGKRVIIGPVQHE